MKLKKNNYSATVYSYFFNRADSLRSNGSIELDPKPRKQ